MNAYLQSLLEEADLPTADIVIEEDPLLEKVEVPAGATFDDIAKMMDATKRGLGLVNKLKDKAQRKRHASAVLSNMNIIRKWVMNAIKAEGTSDSARKEDALGRADKMAVLKAPGKDEGKKAA